LYRFWITKIFQTSILFETNKFHHGGGPLQPGAQGNCPRCPPLIPALQGGSNRVEGNGNFWKTKNIYQLCLFLFNHNFDLKNNNRNYRKSWNFLSDRIAAINLFQFNLDKPWNCLWYFYKRAPPPPLPLFERARRQCPRCFPGVLDGIKLITFDNITKCLTCSETCLSD